MDDEYASQAELVALNKKVLDLCLGLLFGKTVEINMILDGELSFFPRNLRG